MNFRSEDAIVSEIRMLCGKFQQYSMELEKWNERKVVKHRLEELCQEGKECLDVKRLALLLALLDAYEITRDEAMLQEILDVVSKNLEQLDVSAEGVKLLAYCYYYVEEEECLVRARKMLEELKRRGVDEEELAEAEKVLEELTGNF